MSRRDFIKFGGVTLADGLVAGCQAGVSPSALLALDFIAFLRQLMFPSIV